VSDERKFMDAEEAIALLPDGDEVHTFRSASFGLIGADWERAALVEAIREAKVAEVTGPAAQGMKHGLAIQNGSSPLFIETVRRTDEEAAQ
jgi:hypothetical protein